MPIRYHYILTFLIATLTTFFCVFLIIFFFFHAPTSLWNNIFEFDTKILLLQSSDPNINTLDLASLTEIWKYQSSLYELIITVLIGINAVIAIIAFVYIHGKANESINNYLRSDEFKRSWEETYEEFAPDVFENISKFEDTISTVEKIKAELDSQRKDIGIIANYISQSDNSEESSSSQILIENK